MKKAALVTLLCGVVSSAMALTTPPPVAPSDSIIFLFGKKTRIAIQTDDKAELKALKNYDLNALVSRVIDIREKADQSAGKDTTFVVNGDTVDVKQNQVIIRDKEKRTVTFSIKIGGRDGETTVEGNVDADDDDDNDKDDDNDDNDKKSNEPREVRKFKRTRGETYFDLGLNNYLTNGQFPNQSEPYALRPFGSRYVAISYVYNTRIGGGKSPLGISYGLEASFYNFMFDGNQRIRRGTDQVEFVDVLNDQNRAITLRKSKLTAIYGSIPIMITLDFDRRGGSRSGEGRFRLGLGGYAGYRLHSYSKIKEDDGRKNRERNSFYLNNVRYGLQGMIGVGSIDLIFKYDLSPLFDNNQGPAGTDLQAVSLAFRF